MRYVWSDFGVLKEYKEDDLYVWAINHAGDKRKISKKKYKNYELIKSKLKSLTGKPCVIRTSQNTSDWSALTWFSDISINSKGSIDLLSINLNSEETEEIAVLEKKIDQYEKLLEEERQAMLKVVEQVQDEKEKNNKLQNEISEHLIELSKLKSELASDYEILSTKEQNSVNEESKKISDIRIVDTMQAIEVAKNSHPRRELALRFGLILPDHIKRLDVKVLENIDRNNYLVEFLDNGIKASMSIGFDRKLFAKSFRNLIDGWFVKFEDVIGEPEGLYKDRKDLSLEQLVKIHEEVCKKIDFVDETLQPKIRILGNEDNNTTSRINRKFYMQYDGKNIDTWSEKLVVGQTYLVFRSNKANYAYFVWRVEKDEGVAIVYNPSVHKNAVSAV